MINTKGIYSKIFSYSKVIKEELKINENTFNNTEFEESNESFDFWIYSIVDDIYKAGIKVTKEQEIIESDFKKDSKVEKKDLDIGLNFERYLFENISIEIDMWIRKMTEHIINLILLRDIEKKDLENISKIYFLSLKLKDTLTKITNYNEYYSIRYDSGFIEKDIIIEKLEELLDGKAKPFFLESIKFERPGQIVKSIAKLYIETIQKCNNNEKLILGITYNNYHNITQGIHGNGHYRYKDISLDYCISKYNHLGLLLINIISIIYELKDIKKDEFLSKIDKLDEKLENNFEKKYDKGDLVIFKGDLYEIKDVKISSYGYISYLIYRKIGDFINEKYIPQILIEQALTINNFKLIINQIKGSFKEGTFVLYQKMKKDEQFKAIKNVILDLNKNGINIFKQNKSLVI